MLIPFLLASLVLAPQRQPKIPAVVEDCLERPVAKGIVDLDVRKNPVYLRGDFDADGSPDHAVAVRSVRSRNTGILVCLATGQDVIMGADKTNTWPSPDVKDLFAPLWFVNSRSGLLEENKAVTNPKLPVPNGEVIEFVWEDGVAFLYWDGTQFRWSPIYQ